MKRQFVALGLVVALGATVGVVGRGTHDAARAAALHPSRVVRASGADRSLPLRDVAAAAAERTDADQADADQVDTGGKRPSHEDDPEDDLHRPAPRRSSRAAHERDAALQSTSGYHASATTPMPAPMQNFNGLNNARNPTGSTNITPPDTNIAVGTHYILEAVNQSIAVFSKGGALRSGFPTKVNALWS